MAHFAKLDNNNIVIAVLTVNDENALTEEKGIEYLTKVHGYTNWKKTSYNTREGIHYEVNSNIPSQDQTKAFRANFARVGYVYDATHDIFRDVKPENCDSWTLNTISGIWEAPVKRPTIEQMTDGDKEFKPVWSNSNNRWEATNDDKYHYWNPDTSSWINM